ncbi:MAG: glutamate racemase [Clostridia bacterium]|nr:glutamate racemase [Clostridia bacterium]
MPNNENIRKKPIGVFDSGLGGLSAVRELIKILPNEDIVYFGDTGRVPYGNKSNTTVIRYAKQDIAFLLSKGVKAVVAACGTVSSVYKPDSDLNIPFFGVLTSTCMKAVNSTKNGRIGVIGTSATIKSKSYEQQIKLLDKNVSVFVKSCPLFVPLVENGFVTPDNQITKLTVAHYLKELKNSDVDTLILGCTHYPLISHIISDYMGSDVTLINSGKETALYTRKMLKQSNLLNPSATKGNQFYYISDTADEFKQIAGLFLQTQLNDNVQQINIENY